MDINKNQEQYLDSARSITEKLRYFIFTAFPFGICLVPFISVGNKNRFVTAVFYNTLNCIFSNCHLILAVLKNLLFSAAHALTFLCGKIK